MLGARRPADSGYAGLIFILVKCGNIHLFCPWLSVYPWKKIISVDETILGL